MQIIIRILMPVYLALAVVTGLISSAKYRGKIYLPLKLLTSGGFLLLYALCEIEATGTALHLFAIPFIFCFLGDLFMGLHTLHVRNRDLLLGIVFFAIGHVAFLACFYWMDPTLAAIDLIIPVIIFVVALILIKKVAPNIGKMAIAVAAYSLFVSALAAKAVQISILHTLPNLCLLIGIGGVLFLISDFVLFFIIFAGIKSEKTLSLMSVINLTTYYAAVLALILGFICDKI